MNFDAIRLMPPDLQAIALELVAVRTSLQRVEARVDGMHALLSKMNGELDQLEKEIAHDGSGSPAQS